MRNVHSTLIYILVICLQQYTYCIIIIMQINQMFLSVQTNREKDIKNDIYQQI